jgi:hypothetical protein
MKSNSSAKAPAAPAASNPAATNDNFHRFYRGAYLSEHQHPLTIALHVFGTLAGLIWLVAMPLIGLWYLVVLFPVVHAAPGLLAHRLVERNAAVGDLRVTRQDFPVWWFIIANHRLCWDLLRGKSLAPTPNTESCESSQRTD